MEDFFFNEKTPKTSSIMAGLSKKDKIMIEVSEFH